MEYEDDDRTLWGQDPDLDAGLFAVAIVIAPFEHSWMARLLDTPRKRQVSLLVTFLLPAVLLVAGAVTGFLPLVVFLPLFALLAAFNTAAMAIVGKYLTVVENWTFAMENTFLDACARNDSEPPSPTAVMELAEAVADGCARSFFPDIPNLALLASDRLRRADRPDTVDAADAQFFTVFRDTMLRRVGPAR